MKSITALTGDQRAQSYELEAPQRLIQVAQPQGAAHSTQQLRYDAGSRQGQHAAVTDESRRRRVRAAQLLPATVATERTSKGAQARHGGGAARYRVAL